MNQPTPEDMAVDLSACLGYIHCYGMVENRIGDPWSSAIRRAIFAEAEVTRLQAIITGLAERVAAQSELLSLRAERTPT